MTETVSVIIPAKNEAQGLALILPELIKSYPEIEIVIVNDGSSDTTEEVCRQYPVKVVNHYYSMGNGAAIKSGARAAQGDVFVFMDADGQHQISDIAKLLNGIKQGYDMVVGSRDRKSQANIGRHFANELYNNLATWMVNHTVEDLTSGFRAVRARYFKEFLHLLPNGFSYPSTITMAFFRAGHSVAYVPIHAKNRLGKSHINPLKDGVRFFLIMFRVCTLYSPLKIFLPISLGFFAIGLSYYLYSFLTMGRFTNMSALLFITSVLVFLIGLISEQITMLMYQTRE